MSKQVNWLVNINQVSTQSHIQTIGQQEHQKHRGTMEKKAYPSHGEGKPSL